MKYLIFLMLLLSSCFNQGKNVMSFPEMDLKLTQEWMYTQKLDGLKNNGEVISRPPGFEQLVMTLNLLSQDGLSLKKHCVYYLAPYKEKISNFKIQEIKHEEICPENSETGSTFLNLNGIDHFKVSFSNFKLSLEFEYQKQKQKIEIPTPNIELGLEHTKYQAIKEKRLMSGLKLLRLTDESFDFASNRYLGKLSDRFSRGSAIRCHQVDKNCETIGENRCDDCRYGWYEVADFQCPQGGSKFCGQNHCGEKNEPACPRGIKVVDIEDAGICQSDLEPVPNADKILLCQ